MQSLNDLPDFLAGGKVEDFHDLLSRKQLLRGTGVIVEKTVVILQDRTVEGIILRIGACDIEPEEIEKLMELLRFAPAFMSAKKPIIM